MVKAYLDTSVLVASLLEDHPHHGSAASMLQAVSEKKVAAITCAHTLAELYSVLTRTPFTPRIYPSEAWMLIEQNILPTIQVVALTAAEYISLVKDSASAGHIGGTLYDSIHLFAARAHNCDRVYTLNVREFRSLAGEELRDRISSP